MLSDTVVAFHCFCCWYQQQVWMYQHSCRQVAPDSMLAPGFIYVDPARGRRQVGTFTGTWLSWLFPHRSALLGPCHSLLWGAYGTLCPRGSAVAKDRLLSWKSMEVLLQSCSARILPCACSHTCVGRTHYRVMGRPHSLQLFWSPAVWLCIHKSERILKCCSGVGLNFSIS